MFSAEISFTQRHDVVTEDDLPPLLGALSLRNHIHYIYRNIFISTNYTITLERENTHLLMEKSLAN